MRCIAVIPARYGSERFPGKPLQIIKGKPMIYWTYTQCKRCNELDQVLIATDDERILDVAHDFGAEAVMTSNEHECGTERIIEAISALDLSPEDIVINVQGDEPVIDPEDIDLLAKAMKDDVNMQIATLKVQISEDKDINNPNIVKVVSDNQGHALYFSRSRIPFERGEDSKYYKHLGIYAYRKSVLDQYRNLKSNLEGVEMLEQLRFVENGIKIKTFETMNDSIGVDTIDDIKNVEVMIDDKY